jgi:hypothetical protein
LKRVANAARAVAETYFLVSAVSFFGYEQMVLAIARRGHVTCERAYEGRS